MALRPLRHLAAAFRQHWIRSLAVAVVAASLTLLALCYFPPQYACEARLPSGAEETVAEWISPAALAAVVEKLGNAAILPADREAAVELLQRSVRLFPAREKGEWVLRVTHPRPESAQQIVAALIDIVPPPAPREPVVAPPAAPADDPRERLEQAWQTATARLQAAQDNAGLSPEGRRKLIEDQLAEVELQLGRQLAQHEAAERRLAAHLTEEHPQLIAVRQTVARLAQPIDPDPQAASDGPLSGEVGRLSARRRELRRQLAGVQQEQRLLAAASQDAELARSRLSAYVPPRPVEKRDATPPPAEPAAGLVVLQPAGIPWQSGGIQPRTALLLGTLLGLVGSVAVPLGSYRPEPLLSSCRDLASLLELAVIGPIPVEENVGQTAV